LKDAISDIPVSASCTKLLFDTLTTSMHQILRLSTSVTSSKRQVSELLKDFVAQVHQKIENAAEAVAQE
jgi:hypothetical protein